MLSEEISNAEVQKSKNEKLIAKHTKARDGSEQEISQIAEELEKLEEDVANQASDASGWRQKADEAQEVSAVCLIRLFHVTNVIPGPRNEEGRA